MQNKELLLFFLGGAGVFLLLRYFRKPLRLILRLLLSTVLGGGLLMLFNTFGAKIGMHLAVNPATALISGILGVPGVLALLFIKLWL